MGVKGNMAKPAERRQSAAAAKSAGGGAKTTKPAERRQAIAKAKSGSGKSGRTAASGSTPKPRRKAAGKGRSKSRKARITLGSSTVCAIIFLVLALVFIPKMKRRANETGATVPKDAFSYMLDISHHQKHIVWDSLRVMTDAHGRTVRSIEKAVRVKTPDYVVMKATEGENFRDDRFAEYWAEAGKREIRRGAYHFFHAGKSPEKQAQNFIRTVGEMSWRDLPPVLDVETMPSSMKRAEFNKRVLECLKALEEHYKVRPVIYAPDSYIRDIFDDEIRSYPLWVAHYECEKPVTPQWKYWQFTDKAVVHGIEGKVDLSIIR